jgi:hypothetical protein
MKKETQPAIAREDWTIIRSVVDRIPARSLSASSIKEFMSCLQRIAALAKACVDLYNIPEGCAFW